MIEEKKCWKIEDRATVCKEDEAVLKGDPSVGMFRQEIEVKEVTQNSVIGETEKGEEVEVSLNNVLFQDDLDERRIMNIKRKKDHEIDEWRGKHKELERETGENLEVGEEVVHTRTEKRGEVKGVGHTVRVEWKDNTTTAENADDIVEAEEWDRWEDMLSKASIDRDREYYRGRRRSMNWDRF